MGITIYYRGTVNDISEIPLLEDRMLDFAYSMGGKGQICRFVSDTDPTRVVRGLILDLAPGQESLSLLISPEGHLTPLFQIEEAEQAPFREPPCCFVKTQFGSPNGHIAIVHLLHALRQRFVSNLTVTDEGEYYETRDTQQLIKKMAFLNNMIASLAKGMKRYPISHEAMEDPDILVTRIERVAQLAYRSIVDAETPPDDTSVSELPLDDADDDSTTSLDDEVDKMQKLSLKNEQRMERMIRRIEDATTSGLSYEEAFRLAMQDEGLQIPQSDPAEAWRASLPSSPFEESADSSVDAFKQDAEDAPELHPAVVLAQDFLFKVMRLRTAQQRSNWFRTLEDSACQMVGGLVQATSGIACDDSLTDRALVISQLKRAFRGEAYARGAVWGLKSEGVFEDKQATQLFDHLDQILDVIQQLSAAAWQAPHDEDAP
jgi:hypothetical protein